MIVWSGLALWALFGAGAPRDGVFRVDSVSYVAGDSASWSSVDASERGGTTRPFWRIPRPQGIVWIRARVSLAARPDMPPAAVYVATLASREVWWDGVPIGAAGRVGRSAAEEIAGPVESLHHVPDSLATPGAHVVALRASAFHQGFSPANTFWNLSAGPDASLTLRRRQGAWIALVSLSGILLGTLLAFATFALDPRDRAALLLGLTGLAATLLLGAEAWRPLFGYVYSQHVVRLAAIGTFTWITCVLLSAFVVERFPRRNAGLALGAVVVALCVAPLLIASWDDKLAAMHGTALAFAVLWSGAAVLGRARGAIPASIGCAIALAFLLQGGPAAFLDRGFYFGMDVLLGCLLLGHLIVWRDERAARDRALARSARLEAELLKRHLQPHFLMNTLTAIGGWIEEDPPTAVRMIGALGDELRVLTRISDRVLVPIAEELRLCRAHLETMSLRRDVQYRLETDGVDEHAMVPPASFHTLVENAVTHGEPAGGEMLMKLTARREGSRTRYTFEAPSAPHSEAEIAAGMGTRYLEARLREAWGDDWSVSQGEADGSWRVELDVPADRNSPDGTGPGASDYVNQSPRAESSRSSKPGHVLSEPSSKPPAGARPDHPSAKRSPDVIRPGADKRAT